MSSNYTLYDFLPYLIYYMCQEDNIGAIAQSVKQPPGKREVVG